MAATHSFKHQVRSLLRDRLLDAAEAEVERCGWRDTRMIDIARAVGVSRQTVYNEFGTKQGLLEELVLRLTEHYLRDVAEQLEAHDTFTDAVAAAVEYSLNRAADEPLLKALLTIESGAADALLPLMMTPTGPVLETISEMLGLYFQTRWPDLDEEEVAVTVDAAARLLVTHIVAPREPAEVVAKRIAWLAERVLRVDEGAARAAPVGTRERLLSRLPLLQRSRPEA
jgi:AcrR family transcriptional regulator